MQSYWGFSNEPRRMHVRIFPPKGKRLVHLSTDSIHSLVEGGSLVCLVIHNGLSEPLRLWREPCMGWADRDAVGLGGTVAHIRTVQHLCCWNQRKWHGTPKVSATSLLLSIFRSIFALHKIHSVASFLSSWLADSYQNDLSQESKCSKQMFLVATCVKAVIDIHLLHHHNWYTWQNTVINHCTGEHRYPYIRQALPLYSKCLF